MLLCFFKHPLQQLALGFSNCDKIPAASADVSRCVLIFPSTASHAQHSDDILEEASKHPLASGFCSWLLKIPCQSLPIPQSALDPVEMLLMVVDIGIAQEFALTLPHLSLDLQSGKRPAYLPLPSITPLLEHKPKLILD